MIRPADLPGWVLTRSNDTPSGTDRVTIWRNGTLVPAETDPDGLRRALDPSTPTTMRVATAAAGLLTTPTEAGLALVAVPRTPAALGWRWCLVNQAVAARFRVTTRPARLLSCAAVWTYAESPVLEPLWCTAAVAGIPLIWVSPTTPPEEALRHAPVVDSRRPQR